MVGKQASHQVILKQNQSREGNWPLCTPLTSGGAKGEKRSKTWGNVQVNIWNNPIDDNTRCFLVVTFLVIKRIYAILCLALKDQCFHSPYFKIHQNISIESLNSPSEMELTTEKEIMVWYNIVGMSIHLTKNVWKQHIVLFLQCPFYQQRHQNVIVVALC